MMETPDPNIEAARVQARAMDAAVPAIQRVKEIDPRLVKALNDLLALCEVQRMPSQDVDLDDPEVQLSYLVVLMANRIDVEILMAAGPDVLSLTFFPKAGAIVTAAKPHRDRLEGGRNRMRGWVDAYNPDTGTVDSAPPHRVLDGRLVPTGGNGVAFVGTTLDALRLWEARGVYDPLPDRQEGVLPPSVATRYAVSPEQARAAMESLAGWHALPPEERARLRGRK